MKTGMEPIVRVLEQPNRAAARMRTDFINIPIDPSDDDETVCVESLDDTVTDAWAGIEAPDDEAPDEDDVQPEIEPEVDPMAFETPPPSRATFQECPAEIPDSVDPDEPDRPEKGGWVVALLCAGVGIIAVCLLLPLAEENHHLAWQREKLKVDLAQIHEQVRVNEEFLNKINNDPTLAERLAQRQMKFIRKGTTILDLPENGREETSPFQLVNIPAPVATPPYRPLGGVLSVVISNSRVRLYATGFGLLLLASGLVLGGEGRKGEET
jgi:hypothetical protein